MTFDKFLNRSISILLSCVMVVFITIITLLVTPVSVHAVDSINYLEQYKRDTNDFRVTYIYPDLTLVNQNASAYGDLSLTNQFSVSSGDVLTLYCNEVYPNENCTVVIYAGTSILSTFKLNSVRSSDYTFNNSYSNISLHIQNYAFSAGSYPYSLDLTEYFSVVPISNVQSFNRTITIKPGYVAYVQTDGGTLDLVAQFHEYSRFSRPLWDNGVRISFNGGLVPTSGTVFNESFGSSVDWLKVASAPSNLLGQTMTGGRSYTAGLPAAGSNKCVVIYNPAYGNANSLVGSGTIDLGVYISATFSNVIDVTQYKLRADATVTYTSGAAISSGSPDNYDLAYSYIPTDNDPSDVVTDSDYRLLNLSDNTSGPAIDMTAGGYNSTSDYENDNPEEAENGILGLLTRIFKFLSAPVSHIMSLFNAGGNFMAWLGQLWVWLPSDVGAILVDALIVLIVIGAIKFLWK